MPSAAPRFFRGFDGAEGGADGVAAGGALLVYLAPGDMLPDGRPKFDPMRPDDKVLLGDMEGVWDIGRHLDEWAAAPEHGPRVLIYGPKGGDRHIAAAVPIDTTRWHDPSLKVPDKNRWNIPLVDPPDMDARSLRGRQVEGIEFEEGRQDLLRRHADASVAHDTPQAIFRPFVAFCTQ